MLIFTAWKLSNYWVISGPYFLVFNSNTGKYRPENISRVAHIRIIDMALFTYFLTSVANGFVECIFPINGDTINGLLRSAEELTLCCLYRSNQPLWKIHGIAYINFNCFVIDESSQRNQAVLGLFFSRFMLGTISRLLRKNPCVNFIIKWRLPFCANFQVSYIPRPIKHLWWKSRWCYMIPVDWDEILSCFAGILAVL